MHARMHACPGVEGGSLLKSGVSFALVPTGYTCSYLACKIGHTRVGCPPCRTLAGSGVSQLKPIGYSWSCLACGMRFLVLVRQPHRVFIPVMHGGAGGDGLDNIIGWILGTRIGRLVFFGSHTKDLSSSARMDFGAPESFAKGGSAQFLRLVDA
jgi:hypothetical protein